MQGGLSLVIYMVAFFALMYFLIIRPQKKKNQQLTDMRSSIKKGDEVVTIGGIVGTVLSLKEDDVVLEVGSARVKLKFKKWAISSIEKTAVTEVEFEEATDEEIVESEMSSDELLDDDRYES